MKLKNKRDLFVRICYWPGALRSALQDPALYLDLCREAGFCFYYCLNAADERAFFSSSIILGFHSLGYMSSLPGGIISKTKIIIM